MWRNRSKLTFAPLTIATRSSPAIFVRGDILLHAGDRERTGRLGDRARVVEDVLDRAADFVGGHDDDRVDTATRDLERLFADLRHRRAVSEQIERLLAQLDAPVGRQRRRQAGGAVGLDPDDLHVRSQVFDVRGDAGNEAAAADRHEDRVQRAAVLVQDLHADGALSRDHVRIIERMYEHVAVLAQQLGRVIAASSKVSPCRITCAP